MQNFHLHRAGGKQSEGDVKCFAATVLCLKSRALAASVICNNMQAFRVANYFHKISFAFYFGAIPCQRSRRLMRAQAGRGAEVCQRSHTSLFKCCIAVGFLMNSNSSPGGF